MARIIEMLDSSDVYIMSDEKGGTPVVHHFQWRTTRWGGVEEGHLVPCGQVFVARLKELQRRIARYEAEIGEEYGEHACALWNASNREVLDYLSGKKSDESWEFFNFYPSEDLVDLIVG